MTYREIKPGHLLKAFVKCYYTYEASSGAGFDDYVFGDGISLIEWADRHAKLITKTATWLSFEIRGENARAITEGKAP
jgi:tRNA A37 threonylcarbamoyladenosine biosynthesis protein TsaE